MIKPYSVAICQSKVSICTNTNNSIQENLDRTAVLIQALMDRAAIDVPVRLVSFPEFFLQGWAAYTVSHSEYVKKIAIRMDGPEMGFLSDLARKHHIFLNGTVLALDEHWDDRFFNVNFIIDDNGKLIHRYYKLNTTSNGIEHSMSPHDMYDEFVRVYGEDLSAFFPVAKTEIGNLGTFTCMDGWLTEVARGLAVNGAEVLLRPTAMPSPWQAMGGQGTHDGEWVLQNRAHAHFNACYLAAPNWGESTGQSRPAFLCPGGSIIVDYRGRVLAMADYVGESCIFATINIEELRYFREVVRMDNNIPHIKSEIYRKIYDKPIWPKNCFLHRPAETLEEVRSVMDQVREKVFQSGIFQRSCY